MGCLYEMTVNGKPYIGITMFPKAEHRLTRHLYLARKGSMAAVHCAIRKYGPENVSIKTLAISHDWEYLQLIEKRAIQVWNSLAPNGYNLTTGGDGHSRKHTAESRAKMSNTRKGNTFFSPEHRARISVGQALRWAKDNKIPYSLLFCSGCGRIFANCTCDD